MPATSRQISELIQHSAWVERLARCLVRDPNAVEELVQETWLRALASPPRASGPSASRRAFLGRVLRNLVRQGARENRHRVGREQSYARHEALPGTASLVAAAESQRALVEEVLGLPEAQRDTLLLRYFQDLSSAEIARRTGVSAATVRSRLKRGLAELRTRLDAKAGGDSEPQLLALAFVAPTLSGAGVPLATATPIPLLAALMSKTQLLVVLSALALVCGVMGAYGPWPEREHADHGASDSQEATALHEPAPRGASSEARLVPGEEPIRLDEAVASRRTEAPSDDLPATTLHAMFVDGQGRALRGVQLKRQSNAQDSLAVRSDERGEAWLPCESGAETIAVAWCAKGFLPGAREVRVKGGEVTALGRISLRPEAVLHGQVVDTNGQPVADATVWVDSPLTLAGADVDRLERQGPGTSSDGMHGNEGAGVRTDGMGRFRIDEIEPGTYTVWAHRRDSDYAWLTPVDALPGEGPEPLEIKLTVLDRSQRIEGVVQDALGRPYPDARLHYSVVDGRGAGMSALVSIDDEGRFQIRVQLAAAYDLVAEDPHADAARPLRAYLNAVEPGTLDVVLRLGEAELLDLRVRDGAGAPIERVSVIPMIGDERSSVSVGSYPGPHPDGLVELPKPARPFLLSLHAPGYRDLRLGPFDPELIQGVLDIELETAPRVAGVVTADGRPVAGARVRIYRPTAKGSRRLVDGWVVNFSSEGPTVTTDTDGTFELHHMWAGPYRVVAHHDDHADGETETIELGLDEHRLDLELSMDGGGSLVVQTPKGTPAGATVLAHRGIGDPCSAIVDSQGIAVFPHLAEGRWLVQLETPELRERRGSVEQSGAAIAEPFESPWTCVIRAGQRTEWKL